VTEAQILESVVLAAPTQVGCSLGEEVMILNLEDGVYYGLDAVGSRIWELLQKPRSVAEICEVLVEEFEVEKQRCEQDLLGFLRELHDARLIEVTSGGID
jgi:hypothetical protein